MLSCQELCYCSGPSSWKCNSQYHLTSYLIVLHWCFLSRLDLWVKCQHCFISFIYTLLHDDILTFLEKLTLPFTELNVLLRNWALDFSIYYNNNNNSDININGIINNDNGNDNNNSNNDDDIFYYTLYWLPLLCPEHTLFWKSVCCTGYLLIWTQVTE